LLIQKNAAPLGTAFLYYFELEILIIF